MIWDYCCCAPYFADKPITKVLNVGEREKGLYAVQKLSRLSRL